MTEEEREVASVMGRLNAHNLLDRVRELIVGKPVRLSDVLGRKRTKAVSAARQAVWIGLHDAGLSWPEIGAIFNRNHSTVMVARGRSKVQRRALEDRVAEEIAAWLEDDHLGDEDPRSYVDVLDREKMAARIRSGDWRWRTVTRTGMIG